MPTVSAIIPTYNRKERLVRAVESVLAQNYKDFEVVVVDDHSPTPAKDVLEEAGINNSKIRIHRHKENQGGNGARNTGIEVADGEYIAFLDDDDEWLETKLERQADALEQNRADAVYTGIEQVREGKVVAVKRSESSGDLTPELLCRNFIGTFSCIMVTKQIIKNVGFLDSELPSWQDWDFYLRLSEEGTIVGASDALVRQYLHGGERISGDYEIKRDVTVPLFREKHQARADQYGVLDEFEATLAAELGWAAISNGEYGDARRHFLRSLRYQKSKRRLMMLATVLGGGSSYRLAQRVKQDVFGDKKIKS